MIEIKISARGALRDADISQFTGNSDGIVGNCHFNINSEIKEADIWFVIEEPESWDLECRVPQGRLIFLAAEVARSVGFAEEAIGMPGYLGQFDHVFTFLDRISNNTHYSIPFLPWMINANHGPSINQPHPRDVNYFRSLKSIQKTRDISVFCSNQDLTADHRMRFRFVEALDSHFGGRIDWFGNGVQSIPQKWEGLAPYKYTLSLENQSSNHVITEKIHDAYLALCFPIYWGAPDINEFFPAESLQAIDAKDLPGSIAVIEKILDEDPYYDRIEALREAKRRVTDEYNFVHRIAGIAEDMCDGNISAMDHRTVTVKTVLQMRSNNFPALLGRSLLRASRFSNRLGEQLIVPSKISHKK